MNNKRKNILIISRSFYPNNSPRALRTTALAVELSEQGHNVTVVTTIQKGLKSFASNNSILIKDMGLPKWNPINLKGRGLSLYIKRIIRRFAQVLFNYPYIEYYFKVRRALKNEKQDYDLLISIAKPYPVHWAVASLRKLKVQNNIARTWIADCGDPFMGQENDTMKPAFYFKWVEKWFMRKADWISVPFRGAVKAYYKEFHSKIKIIPQGFSFPKLPRVEPNNTVPTFAYAGNIGSYRYASAPFLKLLNEIDDEFRFIIYTKERAFYEKYLNHKTLQKCSINSYIPREELLGELQKVDFLIHFPYKVEVQRSLKLIDYAILGKPILSFRNEEGDKEKLLQFLKGDYKNKLHIDNPDQYRIENVAQQFIALCK